MLPFPKNLVISTVFSLPATFSFIITVQCQARVACRDQNWSDKPEVDF